jgi:transcription elongation factor GreA
MDDNQKQYLTKEKYAELSQELEELRGAGRREIAEGLEYAKSLGDLSENAEYQQAREKQAQLESRVAHLEAILKNAVITEPKRGSVADIGSSVVVIKKGEQNQRTYTIVGSEEADMAEGKLSDVSPIGAALLGKKKGDELTVETPGGRVEYEIVDVK